MTELHFALTAIILILVAALYTAHRTNEALRRRVDRLERALYDEQEAECTR